jgi:hypothetical protein
MAPLANGEIETQEEQQIRESFFFFLLTDYENVANFQRSTGESWSLITLPADPSI